MNDDVYEPCDFLLSTFIGVVEEHNFGLGLTVNVGGLLISGNAISTASYAKRLSEAFAAGSGIAPSLAQAVGSLRASVKGDDRDTPEPVYLHMEDVKVLSSSPHVNLSNGLWRCPIDRIDGFMFGSVS